MNLKKHIRSIQDYPKKGILFRDITTLIKNSEAFNHTIDEIVKRSQIYKIDKIAAMESRGFVFASAVSYILKKLFKLEFVLILFASILLFTFVNYKKKLINYKKLNIFFIIFYISILSPFIFVMISPKIFSHFYLFNNIIVI